jgi:DNA polymerase-3 subunit epsilon
VLTYYHVEDDAAAWFEDLLGSFDRLTTSWVWRVTGIGETQTTHQRKVNAGASFIISRSRLRMTTSGPRLLTTNVGIPTLSSGHQSLYLLPDRVLIEQSGHFTDVSYSRLQIQFRPQRFIEDGAIPPDGTRVDTTWRFVKVDGGPDLRFNNNRQLPVMLYGRVDVRSDTGLQWILDVSDHESAARFVAVLRHPPGTIDDEAL